MIRLALVVSFVLASVASAQTPTRLVVAISEMRNDHGSVRCMLFRSADGFPTDPHRAIALASATPHSGRAECVFENLAPGAYAVAVHHDEDGEGDFDTGIFGIPTEGVGASRDAHGTMGPPSFADARFEIHAGENRTRIHMTYP